MPPPDRILLLATARREALRAAGEVLRRSFPLARLAGYGPPAGSGLLEAAGCDPIFLQDAPGLLDPRRVDPIARSWRADLAVVVTPNPVLDYENAYRVAARLAPRVDRFDRGILEPLGVSPLALRIREVLSAIARLLP